MFASFSALDTENLETQILTDLKILVFCLQLPKVNVTFGRFWVHSGLSMPFGPYTMEIQLFKMQSGFKQGAMFAN